MVENVKLGARWDLLVSVLPIAQRNPVLRDGVGALTSVATLVLLLVGGRLVVGR